MTSWFDSSRENEELLSEERLILEITELITEAMEHRGTTRSELASELGVSKSELSQRLRGTRNLSLRTVAQMLHALDFSLEARLVDRAKKTERQPPSHVQFTLPAVLVSARTGQPGEEVYHRTPLRVVKGAA